MNENEFSEIMDELGVRGYDVSQFASGIVRRVDFPSGAYITIYRMNDIEFFIRLYEAEQEQMYCIQNWGRRYYKTSLSIQTLVAQAIFELRKRGLVQVGQADVSPDGRG